MKQTQFDDVLRPGLELMPTLQHLIIEASIQHDKQQSRQHHLFHCLDLSPSEVHTLIHDTRSSVPKRQDLCPFNLILT